MGGIFAQTIVFGAFGVAIALAHDRTQRRDRPVPLAADGARRGARPATPVAHLVRGLLPDRPDVDLRA